MGIQKRCRVYFLCHTPLLFCDLRSGLCQQSNKLSLTHGGTPILQIPISAQLKNAYSNVRLPRRRALPTSHPALPFLPRFRPRCLPALPRPAPQPRSRDTGGAAVPGAGAPGATGGVRGRCCASTRPQRLPPRAGLCRAHRAAPGARRGCAVPPRAAAPRRRPPLGRRAAPGPAPGRGFPAAPRPRCAAARPRVPAALPRRGCGLAGAGAPRQVGGEPSPSPRPAGRRRPDAATRREQRGAARLPRSCRRRPRRGSRPRRGGGEPGRAEFLVRGSVQRLLESLLLPSRASVTTLSFFPR